MSQLGTRTTLRMTCWYGMCHILSLAKNMNTWHMAESEALDIVL
jgi:hypothetical protein